MPAAFCCTTSPGRRTRRFWADMEDRAIRLTYDQGDLEIMSPSDEHERIKSLVGRMIEAMTEELDIPIRSAGVDDAATTAQTPRLGAGRVLLRGPRTPDARSRRHRPERRPTPRPGDRGGHQPQFAGSLRDLRGDRRTRDLASRRGRGARVPSSGRAIRAPSPSPAFPFLPLAEVSRILGQRNETDETTWIRSFRRWVATLHELALSFNPQPQARDGSDACPRLRLLMLRYSG